MHMDDAAELVVTLFWLVLGIVSTTTCYSCIMRSMSEYTLTDKTAYVSAGNNDISSEYTWSVRDYILLLTVQDVYCPEPKAVDIVFNKNQQKDTTVKFDDEYLLNMEGRLQRYYIDNLSDHVNDKINSYDYFIGEDGVGRWRFVGY